MKKNTLPIKWLLLILVILIAIAYWTTQQMQSANPGILPASSVSNAYSQNNFFQFMVNMLGIRGQNERMPPRGYLPASGDSESLSPGTRPGATALYQGARPATASSAEPGSNTAQGENNTGNTSRANAENTPGSNADQGAGNLSESNAETNPMNNSENNSGNNSQMNAENNSGSNAGTNSTINSQTSTDQGSGNLNPVSNSESNTSQETGNVADSNSGNSSDNTQGNNPGTDTGNNPATNVNQGPGNLPGSNPQNNSGNSSLCVQGCYPGCIPGCDPQCLPPGCLLGNVSPSSNLPTINPVPSDGGVSQSIAQQNQQNSSLAQLLASRQALVIPAQQQAQAAKYQTINANNVSAPSTNQPPANVQAKVQAKQLTYH